MKKRDMSISDKIITDNEIADLEIALRGRNEDVRALKLRLTKAKEALENIVKHCEIIAEGLTPHSTVYSIAKKALKETED